MATLSTLMLATILAAPPERLEPAEQQVRAAIQQSVPYIEEKGTWWIEEKKCSSCHRVGPMVWSLAAARQRGFAVSERLGEWFDWAVEAYLAQDATGKVTGAGDKEGVAQLLLALSFFDEQQDRVQSLDKLARVITDGQESDGSWKPGGQLPSQKRPAEETTDVTTMWLTLAIAGRDAHEVAPPVIEKAMGRIADSPMGQSTEWYVARLLLAQRVGDSPTVDQLVDRLAEQQNADGGWGWLAGAASDALGTGMGLYALRRVGVAPDAAAVRRGQQFLVDTQREDGSWAVTSTKANKQDSVEETSVFWGTTWAALGLLASLPQ